MTPDECALVLQELHGTWKVLTVTDRVWIEELGRLDFGAAGTAVVRLRRSLRTAPSVAQFLDEYGQAAPAGPVVVGCERCGHTGWVTTAPLVVTDARMVDGVIVYDQVSTCPYCPLGEANKRVHRSIEQHNAKGRLTVPDTEPEPAAVAVQGEF